MLFIELTNLLQYKLCKIKRLSVGPKGVPFVVTSDGRTIRYPDPLVKVNDSVQVDLASGKIKDFIKFDSGEGWLVFIIGRLMSWINNDRDRS